MKREQAQQDLKQLCGRALALTQRAGARVGAPHFDVRLALGRHQREAERGQERQLVLRALGGVRQRAERFQPLRDMDDALLIGASAQRILPGEVQVVDRAPGVASKHEMHGQLRCNLAGLRAVSCFLARPDPPMQVHAPLGG